jgi:shikimate kinase
MNQQIILLGLKHSGKTSVGRLLSNKLNLPWSDLDNLIETWYLEKKKTNPGSFPIDSSPELFFPRQIVSVHGNEFFQYCETQALSDFLETQETNSWILSTGGGIMVNPSALSLLSQNRYERVYLRTPEQVLFQRIVKKGLPAYLDAPSLDESMKLWHTVYQDRDQILASQANIVIECEQDSQLGVLNKLLLAINT